MLNGSMMGQSGLAEATDVLMVVNATIAKIIANNLFFIFYAILSLISSIARFAFKDCFICHPFQFQ